MRKKNGSPKGPGFEMLYEGTVGLNLWSIGVMEKAIRGISEWSNGILSIL